ncbi:MAG TPA: sialidase family protein [Mycobacteriales bacterium]|nr:sialidase family protein [Mycobacteriales bacterium]
MTRPGRRWLAAVLATAGVAGLCLAPSASAAPAAWVPTLPVQQQARQQLSAMPDGTSYVLDVGSLISLYRGSQHGMVWDPVTYLPPSPTGFLEIRFGTASLGYAADLERLHRTTDGARTWSKLAGPPLPRGHQLYATEVGTAVAGRVLALGGEVYGPPTEGCNEPISQSLFTSPDAGRTWRRANLPRDTGISSITYLDDRTAVILAYTYRPDPGQTFGPCTRLGDRNAVYVTHDGGRTLRLAASCGGRVQLCTSAAFADRQNLIVGRNNGTTFASRDGGRTFAPGPTLTNPAGARGLEQDSWFWVGGLDFIGATGYATTKLGGTFRTDDMGRTWTREASCDSGFSLGIGEVQMFDRNRAIAGGPSCVATRVGGGESRQSSARPSLPAATGPVWTATAGASRVSMLPNGSVVRRLVPRHR